jgi:plasmid maintenance system antidote protein VapI
MTADELREIGEELYGPRWQTKLARALPVSPRAVRYWLAGQRGISRPMAKLIRSLRVTQAVN